jgi:hypothetical protein
MTAQEYVELLAVDCMQLEKALGAEEFSMVRQALTDALMADKIRFISPKYDTALDVAIEGLAVNKRVSLLISAKKGGYVRPVWSLNCLSA